MIYEISFVPHLPSFIVQMRKPISGGRWLNQKGHMGSRSPALWIYLWLFHPASALGKILPLHKQGKKASAPCVETHRASWHVCESAFVLLPDHLQILGRRVWRESAPEALAHSFYTMAKLPPPWHIVHLFHLSLSRSQLCASSCLREHDIHGLWGQKQV